MSLTSSGTLPVLGVPGAPTPCTGCHAGCCRATAVLLTGRDIFRVVTDLKIPFWKFVCRWADPASTISRGVTPQFFFDDDRLTPYVIGLLQTESRAFPGTRKCVFLEEPAPSDNSPRATGRCSIYDDRPVGCRIFPATFDEAREFGVNAVPESVGERQHEEYRLCPRPWSVSDVDPEGALRNLRECQSELELLSAIARRWNDEPGPWPFFPDFLDLVYTALSAA